MFYILLAHHKRAVELHSVDIAVTTIIIVTVTTSVM